MAVYHDIYFETKNEYLIYLDSGVTLRRQYLEKICYDVIFSD